MEILESNGIIPMYQQLADIIRKQIDVGEYLHGDKIPSESQLIEMYNISRITVRNAIAHLVEEGILVKKHGKGTFVAMPAYVEAVSGSGSFTEIWSKMNV